MTYRLHCFNFVELTLFTTASTSVKTAWSTGMYASHREEQFYLNVLTNSQNSGLQDILIACVDGPIGFLDAIQTVFP